MQREVFMEKEEKKNTMIKNIGIVMRAWLKRYPSAWILLPVFIVLRIVSPFMGTLLSSSAVGAISKGDVKNFLLMIGGILIVSSGFSGAINIIGTFLRVHRVYTRLNVFAGGLFRKALNTDYQNIELHKNQTLMEKGANALGSNYAGPEEIMNQTVNILVVLFGIVSYGSVIFLIDWKILVVVLCMFVGNLSLQSMAIKYSDKHRGEGAEYWRKQKYIKDKSLNIGAGKDIRIYQLKGWFHEVLCDIREKLRKYDSKREWRWYLPTISDASFNFLRDFLAYAILIRRVLNGELDLAGFTMYMGLIGSFSSWIYGLSGNFNGLRKASHEFNDYFDFIGLKDDSGFVGKNGDWKLFEEDDENNKASTDSAPEITFRNVGFTYEGSSRKTLKDLNFTIHKGEKIALVGNNGAGKTTIVKLLSGLYRQTEGDILVNGKSINEIGLHKYQDNVSVLFQDTNPLSFSIEENVAGCEIEKIDNRKVWECLEKAGLGERIKSLKNKEKTYITQNLDEEGILLSGGETQKLLLAKALYKNGNLLILDEPTSALDPIAESKIYEEYNQMAKNKTALFISHRLASTKFCDRIMFLDNGKIVEFGTHEELMAKGGKYKEMFEIQSQYYVSKGE